MTEDRASRVFRFLCTPAELWIRGGALLFGATARFQVERIEAGRLTLETHGKVLVLRGSGDVVLDLQQARRLHGAIASGIASIEAAQR